MSTSKIKKIIRMLDSWCGNPRNDRRNEWDRDIKKDLASHLPTACDAAAVSLGAYANWHAMYGTRAILQEDESGWKDIQLSLEYRWLCMQAEKYPVDAKNALVFAHLMVIDDPRAKEAAEIQISGIQNPLLPTWGDSNFGIFGLEVWSVISHDEEAHDTAAASSFEMGIYEDVLNNGLDTPDKVDRLLDYHIHQALTESGYPEFNFPFYELWPVDYFLAKKIHHNCAESSHPLLSLPISKIPETYSLESLDLHPEYENFVSRLEKIRGDKN